MCKCGKTKIILLNYLSMEILCTYSLTSRMCPLPSFPTLNKLGVQPDTVLLFWNYLCTVSSSFQALFCKRNLQINTICSLYMTFWSMVQCVPILSGPEICLWTPQKVQTKRRGEGTHEPIPSSIKVTTV